MPQTELQFWKLHPSGVTGATVSWDLQNLFFVESSQTERQSPFLSWHNLKNKLLEQVHGGKIQAQFWNADSPKPVISSPIPCCVAAQRMRTEIRVILAIAGPILDKPFLSLCFQGGRAWLSSLVAFGLGKKVLWVFSFCREVITAGNRNKDAPLGILLLLSPLCSLQGICLFCLFHWLPQPDSQFANSLRFWFISALFLQLPPDRLTAIYFLAIQALENTTQAN